VLCEVLHIGQTLCGLVSHYSALPWGWWNQWERPMFVTKKMFGMVAVIVILAAMNTAMAIWVLSRTAEMSEHAGAIAKRTTLLWY